MRATRANVEGVRKDDEIRGRVSYESREEMIQTNEGLLY